MEKALKARIIKAAKEGNLFDLLSTDAWKMDGEDLETIAKELAYALSLALPWIPKEGMKTAIVEDLANELSERL